MSNISVAPSSNGERQMQKCYVQEINPLGFGNSKAKISYTKKIEQDPYFESIAKVAVEIIRSGDCMRQITDKDDGCIDGRKANKMLYLLGIEGEGFNEVDIINPAEHKRAKVAGGGYMTSLVMKLALSGAQGNIEDDIVEVAEHLTEQGVYCGTHTGPHINESGVDCGANDRVEEIVGSALLFKDDIKSTVDALLVAVGADIIDIDASDRVEAGFSSAVNDDKYFLDSTGVSRFKAMMKKIAEAQTKSGVKDRPLAVSKHLYGNHQEAFVILNFVSGQTFSQTDLQARLLDEFPDFLPDDLPQAFVVDIPRIEELARAMVHGRNGSNNDFQTAFYAGLAFQFATAATLTDGILRNFIVTERA